MGQPKYQRQIKKKYMETNENEKHNGPKSLACSKSCSNREIYTDAGPSQRARKISNNLHLYLKDQENKNQQIPKPVKENKYVAEIIEV